ncbi:AAA family ATPase [Natranaerobius thermophilus]|uniref:Cobyrinic acid ac-diamide synthase n=1 Tax=Natranaerobius thermophilus (strain ATCC BAA-1301 / DSM 18059 / JW/NM-WN-LF) TaxID=457570 RepID=B2A5I1_NATTJ|nr:AAA family ATPase [Natranaerobius thermophilus]ACB85336.1 Cobyrinic acid ac-diamide synthase [Natranaerobius thermophilus JW/NM-WN-LF]
MNTLLNIHPGQDIKIHPLNNSIYSKEYHCQVIDINQKELKITVPYSDGKLIPLPTKTQIKVTVMDEVFESEILSRKFGQEQSLIIAAPHSILKSRHNSQKSDRISTKVLAITSGKGGVGKSSLAINLAIALSKKGQRVCLVDADLGMANIDVLLKMTPKYNLTHIFNEEIDIFDVIIKGPKDVLVVPGGSGWQDIASLNTFQFQQLVKNFNKLEQYTDIIIFDTGAGIDSNVINFLLASDEILLVTTPEPHAITDAYAMTKVITEQNKNLPVKLIVNKANSKEEGQDVGNKVSFAARQFLGISLEYLGFVQESRLFSKAARNQHPIIDKWPFSPPSKEITQLANNIIGNNQSNSRGMTGFLNKLASLFKK